MSKRGGFDTGPLSWVKGEIDSSFKRGGEALQVFAAGVESGAPDVLALKAAQAHLHQAHGALQIVGIGGITRVTGELEALLADMERDIGSASAAGIAAAKTALQAVGAYLDELSAGARHQPLKLLPALASLAAARGQPKADAVDLYYPDLSGRPPPRDRAGMNLHPDEVRQFLVAQRAAYMRGLLKFYKNDRSGATEMLQAVATIELAQGTAAQRGFWWVALGFFDALVHQALPQDIDARRVCNRIEQQIRRLAEGSPQVAERLLRETLYCIARSRPVSDQLQAVQQAFGLRETIPGEESPDVDVADTAPDAGGAQVLAKMAAALRSIEQVLDAYYRDPSRPDALGAVAAPAQIIQASFLALNDARAAEAFTECVARIRHFAAPGYSANVRDFEEVAQTLSGIGFFVEALAQGPADFEAIMRPMGAPAAGADSAPAAMPTIEAQLQREFKSAQKRVEEWRSKRSDSTLAAQLRLQLTALQKDAAIVADASTEAAVAAMLSEIEAELGKVKAAPAAASVVLAPGPATTTGDSAVDAELLEVYLEEAGEVLASIAARQVLLRVGATAAGADEEPLVTVRRGFHTLKGSGRMVGLTRLGEAAWAIEQTLNLWLQEDRPVSAALLDLIARAHAYFSDSVARLGSGQATLSEQELVARAEAVRRVDEPQEPEPDEALSPKPGIRAEMPAAGVVVEHSDTPGPEPASTLSEDAAAEVEIGGQRVSRSLFELFSGEARTHMATLKTEFEVLKGHGVITDAMLLAVHTLAGIAGTVHFDNLRVLTSAFDRALASLSLAELSSDEEDLVEQAIRAIEQMVVEALGLAEPTPAPELLDRLENIASAVVTETGPMVREEDQMTLPEEEGAIEREAGPPPAAAPENLQAVPHQARTASVVELDDPAAARRAQRMSDEIDTQLLPIFLEEANELMPALAEALRTWHEAPADKTLAQSAKRLLHTLKGSARMAGAMSVGELSHHMESRIEGTMDAASPPATLFEELDTSMDRMGVLFDKLQPQGGPAVAAARRISPVVAGEAPLAAPARAAQTAPRLSMLRVRADLVDRLVNEAGEVAIARGRIEEETRALRAAMMELTDNVARLRSQLREIEIQAESQMQSRIGEAQSAREDFDPLQFDRFTRFQELTRLMAESVNDVQTVQQNLLAAMENTDTALAAQARLNRDLQQDLMRVRMLPLSSLAERLHRVVRQTAKELGKRANLDISGGQVELDRSVLERVTAPLEHMLRNSVAHGIESPESRVAAGKSPIGGIRIEVSQEGNEVLLALSDNGAGLDLARIRERAHALGLIAGQSTFSDAEITDFIFLPGFSTAQSVSELSGRGVGMDVVRSEVASLGGRIELSTESGKGTRFRIFLPLTLAVSQAVLVKCAGQSFAVPAVMVEQVEQLGESRIAEAREARQIEWQGRRYPFRELAALLGMVGKPQEARRAHPVLYLRSGVSAVALQIDEMTSSSQEIVVKTIGPQLARVTGVAGATVLGSGEIALIINPVQLLQRAEEAPPQPQDERPGAALPPLVMVVDDSLTVRKITGRLLERQGYRVVTARDGLEALEGLAMEIPDVMLVDVEMPRMDGFDLTRSVRADERFAAVPIIMISSRTADKHQQYARDIGVDHYLGKPYQEDELLRHVSGFIAAVRSSAAHRE